MEESTMIMLGLLGGGGLALNLAATTTGASETITLEIIGVATGETCVVNWGDGSAAQDWTGEATRSHVYASAGTYSITVSNPAAITTFDIRTAAVGCAAGEISKLTNLAVLTLNNAYNIVTSAWELSRLTSLTSLWVWYSNGVTTAASEIGNLTNLTYLKLGGVSGVTIGAGEIGGLTSLTYLYLNNASGVTIGAGEIGGLTSLTYLGLDNVSGVTIGAGEIGGLTSLAYLTLVYAANAALQTGLGNLTAIRTIRYENALTTANVDSVIAQVYDARAAYTYATPSLDLLGGNNQAPSATPTVDTYIPALTGAPYNWTIQVAS